MSELLKIKQTLAGLTKDMKDIHQGVGKALGAIEFKVHSQHKVANSIMTVLKQMDARINTIQDLCSQKGLFTEQDFEQLFDHNTGFTRRVDGDEVLVGDVAWVSFKMEGEEVLNPAAKEWSEPMPIRVGAKAIIFDETIPGRKVGEEYQWKTEVPEDGKAELRELAMSIRIVKSKFRIPGATDDYSGTDDEVGDGSAGVEHSDQAQVHS